MDWSWEPLYDRRFLDDGNRNIGDIRDGGNHSLWFFAFGKDDATMAALFMIGVNICLGREKNRLRGLFLMIPFPGIINGLFVPVLLVPPYLFALQEQETIVYQFTLYGVLFVLLFSTNMAMQLAADGGNVQAADRGYGETGETGGTDTQGVAALRKSHCFICAVSVKYNIPADR